MNIVVPSLERHIADQSELAVAKIILTVADQRRLYSAIYTGIGLL
jgi:hypothetical protein